jgi:hypothetical protein
MSIHRCLEQGPDLNFRPLHRGRWNCVTGATRSAEPLSSSRRRIVAVAGSETSAPEGAESSSVKSSVLSFSVSLVTDTSTVFPNSSAANVTSSLTSS